MTPEDPESSIQNKDPLLSNQIDRPAAPPPSKGEGRRFPVNNVLGVLIGNLDLKYFFKPLSLYSKDRTDFSRVRFVTDGEFVPVVLAFFLGLQHACVALGQIVMPPLIVFVAFMTRGIPGAPQFGEYGLQAAIIIGAITSLMHNLQFRIPRTNYQIGTGMSAFLGNSLVMGELFRDLSMRIMQDERCSISDAFGKVLGTAAVCSLLLIIMSCIPRKLVKPLFPPVVNGVIVILIGAEAVKLGVALWGGGRECAEYSIECVTNGNVRLPFGSPEYIGLGFFALVLFLLIHLFGSAFLRRNIILFSVMVVYAVSAIITQDGKHYVTGDLIDRADEASFIWTETHKLGFHKSAVLPLFAAYLITYVQATAVMTASLEESGLDIGNDEADRRIQGGLITTAVGCMFSVLATGMPVMPVPQTNSVTNVSGIASRYSGLAGVIWLFIFGVFGKVLGVFFLEVPSSVAGGIYMLLSLIIVMSGIKILRRIRWDSRTRIIVVYSLMFGLGHLFYGAFFSGAIWRKDEDIKEFVETLRYAIITLLGAPYFVGGVFAMILHFILPANMELDHVQPVPSAAQGSRWVEEEAGL